MKHDHQVHVPPTVTMRPDNSRRKARVLIALMFCVTSTGNAQAVPPGRPAARPTQFIAPDLSLHTLRNGLRVYVVEQHDQPVIAVRVVSGGPDTGEQPGKEGMAILAGSIRHKATATRSAADIERTLSALGHELDFKLAFTTSPQKLDSSLAILADVIRNPAFRQQDLDEYLGHRRRALPMIALDPNYVASRIFWRQFYGSGFRDETEQSVTSITRPDISEYERAHFNPGQLRLVIVGDVQVPALLRSLERVFGDWVVIDIPAAAPEVRPTPPLATTTIFLRDLPDAAQSTVWIGQQFPARDSKDYAAMEVVSAVLGGYPGSRLFTALRENAAATYAIRTSISGGRNGAPSSWYGSSRIETAKTSSAIAQWVQELRDLRDSRPVSPMELDQARGNLLSTMRPGAYVESVAQSVVAVAAASLPSDYLQRRLEAFRTMTVNDVRDAATRHLDPSRLIIVVVGNRAVLEPQLRAANIGPIVLVP